jgi:parallel beta-helix repeat protein
LLKKSLAIAVVVLFLGISVIPEVISGNPSFGKTIYVDDDNTQGPWDGTEYHPYQYIQDAIDTAIDGDTVYVYGETYFENVIVDKSIELIGEDKNTAVIDAGGENDTVLVTADGATIRSFTLRNSGDLWSQDAGVDVHGNETTITDNIIVSHEENGIIIWSSRNHIHRNNISAVHWGIQTDRAKNNVISENIVTNTETGICLAIDSYDNIVFGNTLQNNHDALQIGSHSHHNVICNNVADKNEMGLYLHSSEKNVIHGNTFSNNLRGIEMNVGAINNQVFHNNFINNTGHTMDFIGASLWYSSYPSGGNYWDDYYNGSDDYHGPNQDIPGGDGIWDDPYRVSGSGDWDWYPFKVPDGWSTHGSNLECLGIISWSSVKPGETITASFYVQNIGAHGSELDWKIDDTPDWGTWSFIPSSGADLTPEDGLIEVQVTVTAPDEEMKQFGGNITVVNLENDSDFCTLHLSLVTPKNKVIDHPFLRFLENHPNMFPILRQLLGL